MSQWSKYSKFKHSFDFSWKIMTHSYEHRLLTNAGLYFADASEHLIQSNSNLIIITISLFRYTLSFEIVLRSKFEGTTFLLMILIPMMADSSLSRDMLVNLLQPISYLLVSKLSSMHFPKMSLQVAFLLEALGAHRQWAMVGLIIAMDPHVLEKFSNCSECFVA